MLMMTLAAVWLGLLAAAPGLAILVCILLVPVLVRTSMVVRRREAKGGSVGPGEKVALAAGSFMVTLVIVVVTTVAAVGTFCAVCIGVASATDMRESEIGGLVIVSIFLALVVTGLLLWAFSKWVRNRYRRDIES